MSPLLTEAIAKHQANDLAEAEALYRRVLTAEPQQPDALALLGLVVAARGDRLGGADLVRQAISLDPGSALFQFHLGTILMGDQRLDRAVDAFRKATTLQPGLAPAHYNLGNALRASGDWDGAIAAYLAACEANPRYAEAYNNLALTLVHQKQMDAALEAAKTAVHADPLYGEGWRTLCNVAESVRNYPLALEAGEKCIALMADSHFAWFGYGVALNRLDRNEEAIEAYRRALALQPSRVDIWDNLGQTFQSLNRLEDAEATFIKTVEVAGQTIRDEAGRVVGEGEYGNRHWHLALIELLQGKYLAGFARYRSRFREIGGLKRPPFSQPLWQGEDLKGKTILLSDEQGFGDTLMLCRYLPLIRAQGASIVFSVHPALKPLFLGWEVVDQIVVHGERLPHFDTHASVFDLPFIFGTTLETIPSQVPYLPRPAPSDACKLEGGQGRAIGVVWGGSGLHLNDSRRSVPLREFASIFDQKGARFFSLNRDMKMGDAGLLPHLPVTDLRPRIADFADAARFIEQLDLVITCDTATAHLAGGLGKKVWTLLPFAPDWRWLTKRSDSVWYPTMRLFRQAAPSDWGSALKDVKTALGAEIG